MQILRFSALVDVPWKNGSGGTRNIAKGMIADKTVWTVSRADVVQNGPFSDFTGMMRILTVVSGGAMRLDNPITSLEAELWKPVRFDGALEIWSHLKDGPLTDLNLMFDPLQCTGDVTLRRGAFDGMTNRPAKGLLAFHVLCGTPMLGDTPLAEGDTVFIDSADEVLHLGEEDAALEIRLTYPAQSNGIKLCIADR